MNADSEGPDLDRQKDESQLPAQLQRTDALCQVTHPTGDGDATPAAGRNRLSRIGTAGRLLFETSVSIQTPNGIDGSIPLWHAIGKRRIRGTRSCPDSDTLGGKPLSDSTLRDLVLARLEKDTGPEERGCPWQRWRASAGTPGHTHE